MDMILIFVVVLLILIVAVSLSGKEKKVGSTCKNCPEYRYCGGGRPRCARRSKSI